MKDNKKRRKDVETGFNLKRNNRKKEGEWCQNIVCKMNRPKRIASTLK